MRVAFGSTKSSFTFALVNGALFVKPVALPKCNLKGAFYQARGHVGVQMARDCREHMQA